MAGPFLEAPLPDLVISPVGVVPKKAPGKFRLIQHLSFPDGSSVNDAIDPAACSVSYQSFEGALGMVRSCGSGALMAKLDIESAFRLLPLHPESFRFMGFRLPEGYFIDRCLPMGCSISCALFEKFSTFLHWCVQVGTPHEFLTHYLDDFLFVGPSHSDDCARTLFAARSLFSHFGVPVAADKTEGPATCLSYLGIEIDTVAGSCRLPADKVAKLRSALVDLRCRRRATLTKVQSLLGLLNFACKVIPMGRIFSRRLERATAGVKLSHHFVHLSGGIREDMGVWIDFLADFNGIRIWSAEGQSNQDLELFTDAAGSSGFGAYLQGDWCAAPWPASWVQTGLTANLLVLELFPIVVAVELWADRLSNRNITFWCDNLGVVQAINNQRATSPPAICLIRYLVLRCLQFNVCFRAKHVPGVDNVLADALSRFNWPRFRELAPQARASGVSCPCHLWQIVQPA